MSLHNTPSEVDLDNPLDEVEDLPDEDKPQLGSLLAESLSLDNLLDESMGLKREADSIKASRKALAEGIIPSAERAATAALVRAWEARREWDTVAYVARYTVQICECCTGQSHHFEGFFLRQEHRTNSSERWIVAENHHQVDALEKETKTETFDVPMCLSCAVEDGFQPDWEEDEEEEPSMEMTSEEESEAETEEEALDESAD